MTTRDAAEAIIDCLENDNYPREDIELAQVGIVARAWLAEHPSDSDVLVDIDWLNSLERTDGGDFSMLAVRLCDDGFHLMAASKRPTEGIEGIGDWVAPNPATRGDVRKLCDALGIGLKGEV